MNMKHTPGPWSVHGNLTKYVEARVGGGWMQEVCAVGPTKADNGYGQQQDANARLIAAAPDLLLALQCVLPAIDGDPDCSAQAEIVRSAIIKATGEQS